MMHSFRRTLLLCCLVILPLATVSAQDEEPALKPGRSVVRGRVIFADSDQPLRRANVRLRTEFNRDVLKHTLTGKRGEFSFQGLPVGTYYIEVDAPGIISLRNGVSFTDIGFTVENSSLTLVTVDGVNDVKTEIRAVRGGVITGRVSYADDEPATHAQIVLYRQKGQTPVLFFLGDPVFTDDRGVYRLEGLPAGQYIVGATENHTGGDKVFPREGGGFVTAFYPAAANVSAAGVVSVQIGSEARDVNIKYVEEPRLLSGTLKWKQNIVAIKGALVSARRIGDPRSDVDFTRFLDAVTSPSELKEDSMAFKNLYFLSLLNTNSPYTESDEQGRWSFDEVPQGTYIVSVEAPLPRDKPVTEREWGFDKGTIRGRTEVKVADKDIDNLVIELTADARIIGTVTIDGNPAPKNAVAVKVVADSLHSFLNAAAPVKDDGSFVLSSVPAGTVRLDIQERPGSANYYVRSITGKGSDLLNEPLTVSEGEQVTGVQIVLGSDVATVEGRVVAASGDGSVAAAGVVLLPVDQSKWTTRSLWGMTRADSEGRFSLRLAPGEYVAAAWSLTNEPAEPIESYVRSRLSTTQRITLTPNATKTIEVRAATSSREP
jgi:hypothetical protein